MELNQENILNIYEELSTIKVLHNQTSNEKVLGDVCKAIGFSIGFVANSLEKKCRASSKIINVETISNKSVESIKKTLHASKNEFLLFQPADIQKFFHTLIKDKKKYSSGFATEINSGCDTRCLLIFFSETHTLSTMIPARIINLISEKISSFLFYENCRNNNLDNKMLYDSIPVAIFQGNIKRSLKTLKDIDPESVWEYLSENHDTLKEFICEIEFKSCNKESLNLLKAENLQSIMDNVLNIFDFSSYSMLTNAIASVSKGNKEIETGGRVTDMNGVNLYVILKLTIPYSIKNGDFIISIVDYSETLVAMEKIEEQNKELNLINEELRQLDEMKTNFVSTVSHELRTPITAIKGSIGVLLSGAAGEVTEEVKQFLDICYRNTDRLIRLINEILDVSKLKSEKTDIFKEEFKLHDLITDVSTSLLSISDKQNIVFYNDCNKDIIIFADKDKMSQVLNNLLSNAYKFSANGKVTVLVEETPDIVEVCVKDSGPGIKKNMLDKIFGQFVQEDGGTRKKYGGTGLGLAICKTIIDLHEGDIWVESELGKGCEFKFFVPKKHEFDTQ